MLLCGCLKLYFWETFTHFWLSLTSYSPVRTSLHSPFIMIHLIALTLVFFLCSHIVSIDPFCSVLFRTYLLFPWCSFVSQDASLTHNSSRSPQCAILSSHPLIPKVHGFMKYIQVTGRAFVWIYWEQFCTFQQ